MNVEELVTPKVERLERFGRFVIAEVKGVKEGDIITGEESKIYTGIGISRKSDDDRFDINKAEQIAIGRATKALGMKLRGKRINNPFMG